MWLSDIDAHCYFFSLAASVLYVVGNSPMQLILIGACGLGASARQSYHDDFAIHDGRHRTRLWFFVAAAIG